LVGFLFFRNGELINVPEASPGSISAKITKKETIGLRNNNITKRPTTRIHKYRDPLDDPSLWIYKEESPISRRRLPFLIQETSGYIHEADIIYTDDMKIVIVTVFGKQIKIEHDSIWSVTRNPEYHK
jgi:hypothetical protein